MSESYKNTLTVTGNKDEVERFVSQSSRIPDYYYAEDWFPVEERDSVVFSFAGTLPIPQEILRDYREEKSQVLADKHYSPRRQNRWLEWCVEHYGTLDPARRQSTVMQERTALRDTNMVVYYFETCWAPPLAWMLWVSALFQTLKFVIEYENSSKGRATAMNGKMTMSCQIVSS
jgi:hypothetical protein